MQPAGCIKWQSKSKIRSCNVENSIIILLVWQLSKHCVTRSEYFSRFWRTFMQIIETKNFLTLAELMKHLERTTGSKNNYHEGAIKAIWITNRIARPTAMIQLTTKSSRVELLLSRINKSFKLPARVFALEKWIQIDLLDIAIDDDSESELTCIEMPKHSNCSWAFTLLHLRSCMMIFSLAIIGGLSCAESPRFGFLKRLTFQLIRFPPGNFKTVNLHFRPASNLSDCLVNFARLFNF